MIAAYQAPLFVLSFRQRDELASLAAGAGWQVVAARRAGGAERRFLSSGAAVAVIDARGVVREYIPRHSAERRDGFVPPAHAPTLFARLGNWLAMVWAVLFCVIALVASRRARG